MNVTIPAVRGEGKGTCSADGPDCFPPALLLGLLPVLLLLAAILEGVAEKDPGLDLKRRFMYMPV